MNRYFLQFTKTKMYYQINQIKSLVLVVPDGEGHVDIQVTLVTKSQELPDLLKHGHFDVDCKGCSLRSVEALKKESIRVY